jgi:hypothetical protein
VSPPFPADADALGHAVEKPEVVEAEGFEGQ